MPGSQLLYIFENLGVLRGEKTGLAMALDLCTGLLEVAGQSTGGRRQQPEQEKSDAVDTHAAEFCLPRYPQQIDRVECGKKQAGGDTGSNKGRPEYSDNTLDYGYPCPSVLHCRSCCGFHGLRPQR